MAGETRYQLVHPIKLSFRGASGDDRVETIDQVTIRRVTGAEMLILDEAIGTQAKSQRMIAALTGLDELAVRKMDAVDLRAIDAIVEGFYRAWPSNWGEVLGELAAALGFGAEELMAMPIERLLFWRGQAKRMIERVDAG